MIENNELAAELAAADEERLTALSSRGLFKRAVKDVEDMTGDYVISGNSALVKMGSEKCIIRVPLESSSCTCPSRTVCRHLIGAVLLLKRELPPDAGAAVPEKEETPEPEPAKPEPCVPEEERPVMLSPARVRAVRECAGQVLKMLGGLLARGLIRADASAADELELAAVSAHAAGMAEAERLIRNLSKRLNDCTERRASFDAAAFTRLLYGCTEAVRSLDREEIAEAELGSFRAEYEPCRGTLTLLPLGIRDVRGGAYVGSTYYFLNMDEGAEERFLWYSDLRPTFYGFSPSAVPRTAVWGLGNPLRSMMKSRMTLSGARLCGSRLSGSNSTAVISTGRANHDCPQLRRMIIYDYRELAQRLRDAEEQPFLIRIEELAGYGFNKYTQHFGMTVRDAGGRSVGISIRYLAETKQFIEDVEKVCRRMKNERGVWTALVIGRMYEGRVVLEPVEFYSYIDAADMHRFTPERDTDEEEAVYARRLLRHLAELEEGLVRTVRSGLSTVQEDNGRLTEVLKGTGMTSLAGLAKEYFAAAGAYRHDIAAGGQEALLRLAALLRYIYAAKSRLSMISAIYEMEQSADADGE